MDPWREKNELASLRDSQPGSPMETSSTNRVREIYRIWDRKQDYLSRPLPQTLGQHEPQHLAVTPSGTVRKPQQDLVLTLW